MVGCLGCNGYMRVHCLYWDVLVVGCFGCVGLDVMVIALTWMSLTWMSLLGRVSGGIFGMCLFGCIGCMPLQGCLYWDVLWWDVGGWSW